MWKAIKRLIRNCDTKEKINSINGHNKPDDIVREINEFFANVGSNLAADIEPSNLILDFTHKPNIPFLSIVPTTTEEVREQLMKISDSKATGDDGIPIRFLKMVPDITSRIIAHIVNLSFETSTIPNGWKLAVVTPLFKEGDRDCVSNYRPISILSCMSKILERIVHKRVSEHLKVNKLLSEAQFGFRKHHSTATCVLKLTDRIYKNIENGKLTGVVFLDLKKAFDTVDHVILTNKLNTFNLDEKFINWIKNYLTGRKQAVKALGVKSEFLPITCGVPQGSILGPLLFIMYINDLEKYLDESNISLYADDTALYVNGESQIDIMLSLRIELSVVNEWLRANKLTLNASKTKYIVFGSRNKLQVKPDLNLSIGGKKIERVACMKYLGVQLDEFLTFDEHINYIHQKSSKKLGVLRRSREFLDRSTSLLLYKSLIVPYINYCDLVYMCTTAANLSKLQILQNTACRIILQVDKHTHIDYMHKELNIMTLKERREFHMSVECHKNIYNEHAALKGFFIPLSEVAIRTTRMTEANNMSIPNIVTQTGRKAFSFRGPNHWNKLDDSLKKVDKLKQFKNQLQKEILRDVNHPG